MTYTAAKSTRLLATHCVCCGLPLVHAESVERGMGPECSKEGYPMEAENPGKLKLVHEFIYDAALAAQQGRIAEVLRLADSISELGFPQVATKIRTRHEQFAQTAQRNAKIRITTQGDTYLVETPFRRGAKEAFIEAWRKIPGRRFSRQGNLVPVTSKRELWNLLKEFFGGEYGVADGTPFRIPKEA